MTILATLSNYQVQNGTGDTETQPKADKVKTPTKSISLLLNRLYSPRYLNYFYYKYYIISILSIIIILLFGRGVSMLLVSMVKSTSMGSIFQVFQIKCWSKRLSITLNSLDPVSPISNGSR